ncbi:MAG TPA: hypothetical protein VF519_18155 [Mycobacteriales bacterium]|jgi:hypothetical protein
MRRTAALLLLMAGALVAPAIGAFAQVDSGGVTIRLLEAPTAREKDPRAQRSIVDHVKPGSSFSRKFEVGNTTSNRRTIQIYDAAADVQGGTFVHADGRTQNELTSWVTIDMSSADLAPGQKVVPVVTVTVPADASAGERYAVIWAELPPRTPPNGGVAVVNRVGLRIYLSVGPGGEPPTDFSIESLTATRDKDHRPVVQATVRNTGGRALDLTGKLTLTDGPGGLRAGPYDANVGTTLAIGASAPVAVPLDPSLPDGPWKATIEMTSSTTTRTATATITFPSGSNASNPPVDAKPVGGGKKLPAGVVLAVAGGIALLLLLLLLLLFRRRGAEPVRVMPLDDVLTELAGASGARREELMRQAVAYGAAAIQRSPALRSLPVDTAAELGKRVSRAGR